MEAFAVISVARDQPPCDDTATGRRLPRRWPRRRRPLQPVHGVALLSVGAAFFASALLRQVAGFGVSAAYSLGFTSVGLFFLVVGATVALRAARNLTAGGPGVEHSAQAPDGSRESLGPGRV